MPTARENVCCGKTPNNCHTTLAVKNPKLSRDINKISRYHDHISISLNVHTDILNYFLCRISIQLFWMNLCWKWPCGTEMMLWQNLWKIITIKSGDMLRTDSLSCGCMDDLALETEKWFQAVVFWRYGTNIPSHQALSLIHIWRCRRYAVCRSRWSPYH